MERYYFTYVPATLIWLIPAIIVSAILGVVINIVPLIVGLLECVLFLLTPVMILTEIGSLFFGKGGLYKIFLLLGGCCHYFIAFVPFRIFHDSTAHVNNLLVICVLLIVSTLIGIAVMYLNDEKHKSKRIPGAAVVAGLFLFAMFSVLWSYSWRYHTMDNPDGTDAGSSTYVVKHDFSLYKNIKDKESKNQKIGDYPKGTQVVSANGKKIEVEIEKFLADQDSIAAFVGKVRIVGSDEEGYIVVFGHEKAFQKAYDNYEIQTSKEHKKQSVILQYYLMEGNGISNKDSYYQKYQRVLALSEPLYDRHDWLGCKSYEARKKQKNEKITNPES